MPNKDIVLEFRIIAFKIAFKTEDIIFTYISISQEILNSLVMKSRFLIKSK